MKQLAVEFLAVLAVLVLFSNVSGSDPFDGNTLAANAAADTGPVHTAATTLSDEVIFHASPDAIPFPAPRMQRG